MKKAWSFFWAGLIANMAIITAEMEAAENPTISLSLTAVFVLSLLVSEFNISRRGINFAALTAFMVFAAEGLLRADIRILALTHFLMFIQVVLSVKKKNTKEYSYILIISLIQFLAAAVLTESVTFVLFLLAYVAASVYSLIKLKLIANKEQFRESPSHESPQHADYAFALAVTSFVIIFAVFLFPLVPRTPPGFIGAFDDNYKQTTGFSRSIFLGDFTDIMESDQIVFRVSGPRVDYFRGLVFDHYEDFVWETAKRRYHRAERIAEEVYKLEDIPLQSGETESGEIDELQHIKITAVNHEKRALFIPYGAEIIKTDDVVVSQDEQGAAFPTRSVRSGYSYRLYLNRTDISEVPEKIYRNGQQRGARKVLSRDLFYKYTQMPATISSRVSRLAGGLVDDSQNVYEKAVIIRDYLRDNYDYSLKRKAVGRGYDPVEDFLFHNKKGHCEYFASAFVLLMRSLGIPSRLVNGYLSGTNAGAGVRIVRNKDIHAWAEVYIPAFGWLPFDPTPPRTDLDDRGADGWWFQLKRNLESKWRRRFIDFSKHQQIIIISNLKNIIHVIALKTGKLFFDLSVTLKNNLAFFLKTAMIISLMLSVLAIFVFYDGISLVRYWIRLMSAAERSEGQIYAVNLYSRFLRGVEPVIGPKFKYEGPWEYLERIRKKRPEFAELLEPIIDVYCLTRFGGRIPARETRKEMIERLKKFKRRKRQ